MMQHRAMLGLAALLCTIANGQVVEMVSDAQVGQFLASNVAQAPDPFTIAVGDAKFHMITDGTLKPGVGKASVVFNGFVDQAQIDKYYPGDSLDLSFGVTLLQHKGQNYLFDASLGFFNRETLKDDVLYDIRDILKNKLEVDVSDINYVVHSHLHLDHIGWNVVNDTGTLAPTFPNAKHVVQHVDWLYWSSTDATKDKTRFDILLQPLEDAGKMQFVDSNTDFTPNLKFVKRLGHTPGHQVLRFELGGDIVYYIGDAVHTLAQLEFPEWSPIFDWDRNQAAFTRRAMLAEIAKEKAMIISPHFPFPGYGWLSPKGGGWELVKEIPTTPPESRAPRGCALALAVLVTAMGAWAP